MNHISFFFNDPETTEIYTLSLHDALPICLKSRCSAYESIALRWTQSYACSREMPFFASSSSTLPEKDRKSTRLNSSHVEISYAVFCLKKKNKIEYYHSDHKEV